MYVENMIVVSFDLLSFPITLFLYVVQLRNRKTEFCQKTEEFQKWSDEAFRTGKKTFVSGGALKI